VDLSPNGKEPWAAVNPDGGTQLAGKQAAIALTPAPDLCLQFTSSASVTFHAVVELTSGGSGSFTITDTVQPYSKV
jgi:hypothetical protein